MSSTQLDLPDARVASALALKQDTTVADLFWLKLVQYVGDSHQVEAGLPSLAQLVDLITDLDPLYGYAYEVGGIVLATQGRPLEAAALLKKGMANVPDRWQLPFLASFIQWHDLGEFSAGADLLRQAARLPGHPRYLDSLAERLNSTSGAFDASLRYLDEMIQRSPTAASAEEYSRRRTALLVERDLRSLENALTEYQRLEGRPPRQLEDLVGKAISSIPQSPTGKSYRYDPREGRVFDSDGAPRIRLPSDLAKLQAPSMLRVER